MKTKRNVFTIIIVLFLMATSPSVLASVKEETPGEHVERLEKRLEEIKLMDTKKMTREEKKALRGEVKMIKKEMKAVSGGVYLSVGAILLIALLIILLA